MGTQFVGDADELVGPLAGHLRDSDIAAARRVVVVADGAPWVWDRVPALLLRLGIKRRRLIKVVDYYHAVEHLSEVVDGKPNWSAKKRTRWFNTAKRLLKAGEMQELIARIAVLRRGRKAAVFRRAIDYFGVHAHRMRYRWCKRRGPPLGSGVVGGASPRVVN